MNYYNNGSFFALLLVVLQVSTNSPFFVASNEREGLVLADGTVITDSPSSNSTPDSDTSEREGFVSSSDTKPSRCSIHDDCEPRDSFFCVPGFGVCQEKLNDNEQCEDNEWCKEPLTCLDGECVQIFKTRFGGDLCSGDGDCDSGYFCHPNRNFCSKKRGAGVRCKDDNWCIFGTICKGNRCGKRSGDDVGPAYARNLEMNDDECNNHGDCGPQRYCCNPGTMGKIGSFKSCEPRRKIGESCDGNDNKPNRICKNGLKCKNDICCNPKKEKSCV